MRNTTRTRKPATGVRKTIDTDLGGRARASSLSTASFARALASKGLKPVPKKMLLSLRIDADVIEWFRRQGPGYQSRMNALLRAYMEAHL